MKYYVIAGEASGDLHGSNLIKAIKKKDSTADFRGWGGDYMAEAGVTLVKHYRQLAFMGFAEVIKNLPEIMRNFSFCKTDISSYQPDAIIFIDYPGFNLRMAKWAKQNGYRTIYYISPQIWAWKENRVHNIKKYVDKMLVILPFEQEFYQKYNYPVSYVGHPLIEVIDGFMERENESSVSAHLPVNNNKIIALLPGSRRQEISMKLPIMLKMAKHFPDHSFIVAKAPGIEQEFYAQFLQPYTNVYAVVNKTYSLLNNAKAALVTSGTATLETALFAVPEVICYKGGNLSYQIAKRLIKIKFIGLVNLIMDREVVKELIQHELNEENLKRELEKILHDKTTQQRLQKEYKELKILLSAGGHASNNAAKLIMEFLHEKN